ncbi:esterase/lipase family protein [Streptomyces globosus]|uniref:esterase/lipase family protein n=1 Tax=Streptomyces globosus TaxID=68209 RepID=UPI0031E09D28
MNSRCRRSAPALALGLAVLLLPHQASAAPSDAPDPVVFVHGWNSSGSTWDTMAGRFRAAGWPADRLHQWTYPSGQSNAATAAALADEVDRVLAATGAARVDLVAHSMGSLSSRHYLRNLGGTAKVDAWVSLAGPNHGTDAARLCAGPACTEMRPGSAFLQALNTGDETPGATRYATWASPCDVFVLPASTVALDGAENRTTACLGHTDLHRDAAVHAEVAAHVR